MSAGTEQELWTGEGRDDFVSSLTMGGYKLFAVAETATTVVDRPYDRDKRCRSSFLTMMARDDGKSELP